MSTPIDIDEMEREEEEERCDNAPNCGCCYDPVIDSDESDEITVAEQSHDLTDDICKNCDLQFYDMVLTDKEKHGNWCRCSLSDIMKSNK